ncbi:ROK family protein, partial [Tessaracoccus lubricantis]
AGPAIERRYASFGNERASGREIMSRATGYDDDARTVVRDAAVALGRAIAGIVTVVDPAAVVIGGGVADAGPVWWQPLTDTIRSEVISVLAELPVLKAELGSSAALVGAAAQVFVTEEKS